MRPRMESNPTIVLSDGQIETIINGGAIQYKLPNGQVVYIAQSLVKDAVMSPINHRYKIADTMSNSSISPSVQASMNVSQNRLGTSLIQRSFV